MKHTELTALLDTMVSHKASDLFISVGAAPLMKIEGRFFPASEEKLDFQQAHALCYSVLDDEQRRTYESTRELNMSLQVKHLGRFRLNLFRQKGEPALVARHIKNAIPQLDDLNLPGILGNLIMEDRGLILLVGGTGTGKSSTLASMLDHRNARRDGHILTIEDPVEFIHSHKRSLVNQREIGLDTNSYAIALKNAMREAPDVIMIGEIRDMETMKHAIAYAETGHLCVSTLHANNANQAIERILSFFPDTSQNQVLQDLSLHLKAVVSQRLVAGVHGKRVPVVEVMLNTPFISELIHQGKVTKIKEAMVQAQELGCKTLDDALYDLAKAGKITMEEALRHADSRTNLSLRFKLEGTIANLGMSGGIKKDVMFSRKADFRSYKTFRIRCSRFLGSGQELRSQLDRAFKYTLELKGLAYQEDHPDIELQYAFSAQAAHLELEPVTDGGDPATERVAEQKPVSLQETLLINLFDLHANRPVWRATASAVATPASRSQEQVTREITEILDGFPP